MKTKFKLETVQDVITGSELIKALRTATEDVTIAVCYVFRELVGDISGKDFVALYWVAGGHAIPETVLLATEYPAIEYLRHQSIEDQEKYIRDEESMEFPVVLENGKVTTQWRTYKQLGVRDCEELFGKESIGLTRFNAELLDLPGDLLGSLESLLAKAKAKTKALAEGVAA